MTALAPLVQLRWLAVLLQLGLVVMGVTLPGEAVPTTYAVALVLVGGVSNAWVQRVSRSVPDSGWLTGGVLLFDVALLTGLLAVAQGTSNPFTALYMVHVAIAASVLSDLAAAGIVFVAILAYGSLFLFTTNPHAHHGPMGAHLLGMWVAFAVSAPFVAFTIRSVRRSLLAARDRADRAERLGSLATLAAGAAHELATPLATIQVAVAELARTARPDQIEDVDLVRAQVGRCEDILRRLAVDAGHPAGPPPAPVRLDVLVARACDGLDDGLDVVVTLGELGAASVAVPLDTVARALAGVVHNGLDASPDDRPVRIDAVRDGGLLVLHVRDEGPPVPGEVLARIGEPFFTTKGHEGMGLGVFFARSVLEQVGGSFRIGREAGCTVVSVGLPPA